MCCYAEVCCNLVAVWAAGHAAVGRATVAGQHYPIGSGAPGLDGAALSNEIGPCRALADEPHGFQTESARYSHGCHFGKTADMAAILRLTQLFDPANPGSVLRDGRVGCAELDTSPSDTLCVLTSPTSLV